MSRFCAASYYFEFGQLMVPEDSAGGIPNLGLCFSSSMEQVSIM
jgi:hypothetical protein